MCDERTASRLSTFNSAKRNGLSAENLVNMAQLHDHWTYGLESPTYTPTASLILPKSKASASKTICLPTPTLQDLLNPAAPNEEPSFLCDDPYNTELLDDDSDSESELEDTPVPIVTRTSNLERLEIDALVDLANPKLVARYNESSQPVAATQPPKPAQSRTRTAEWTNENWAARDLDF